MTDDISDDEVREALAAVHAGEAALSHILCLAVATGDYASPLVPDEVTDAVSAKYSMDGDVANGGLDQLVWNQGAEAARAYAAALRAIGAIENADVLNTLADALDTYQSKHADMSKDPVKHFLAYRRSVGGPELGIPDHGQEIGECLIEWVLENASRIPTTLPARKP